MTSLFSPLQKPESLRYSPLPIIPHHLLVLVPKSVVGSEHRSPFQPTHEIRRCSCGSWYCSGCAPRLVRELEAKLVSAFADVHGLTMLIVSIGQSAEFPTGEYALDAIKEKRWISELIRKLFDSKCLKSRRYFAALEFYKDGFPHFHILVDSQNVTSRLARKHWASSLPNDQKYAFASPPDGRKPISAIRYALKTFGSLERIPNWVLSRSQLNRYSSSRGLFASVTSPVKRRKRLPQSALNRISKRHRKSISDRVQDCGKSSKVFSLHRCSGRKLKRRYVGKFDVPLHELGSLCGKANLSAPCFELDFSELCKLRILLRKQARLKSQRKELARCRIDRTKSRELIQQSFAARIRNVVVEDFKGSQQVSQPNLPRGPPRFGWHWVRGLPRFVWFVDIRLSWFRSSLFTNGAWAQ